jgi:NSS family neurotransmitter:Na+ symporter
MADQRAHWGSRLGFILAAAGSAVGLGNIWGFPYMTGRNGGGLFVLVYLLCVALVGAPIMMAEILMGRTTSRSPVGAFRALSRPGSPWISFGWLGVAASFIILSFYSVIAGWSMHYVWLSITDSFAGKSAAEISAMFGALATNEEVSTLWHVIFMVMTIGIVAAGVKGGLELASKIFMPALFILLLALLIWGMTTHGFMPGVKYIVGLHDSDLLARLGEARPRFTAASWLEALGQAFFSLSLGMGALITYGSYLRRDDDLVSSSLWICALDTLVALLAAFIVFPIVFAADLQPGQGPGLVFTTIPIAFSKMPGGLVLAPIFFLLLSFAAITSSISLLEVATSYFIDEKGWTRGRATLFAGGAITLLGIPSAVAGGSRLFGQGVSDLLGSLFGEAAAMNWFDALIYLTFNLMLPIGGLGIATFVAWRIGKQAREEGFRAGSRLGKLYWGWVALLRFVVPIAVLAVLLHALGVI